MSRQEGRYVILETISMIKLDLNETIVLIHDSRPNLVL